MLFLKNISRSLCFSFLTVIFGSIQITIASESPCEQIQRSCGEAGYTRDLPEGRDLMSKCFNPILEGQTVAGVRVDPNLIKRCTGESQQGSTQKKKHSPRTKELW